MLHVLPAMLHVLPAMLHVLPAMLHVLPAMLHVLTCRRLCSGLNRGEEAEGMTAEGMTVALDGQLLALFPSLSLPLREEVASELGMPEPQLSRLLHSLLVYH
jgi:hypothetical protein